MTKAGFLVFLFGDMLKILIDTQDDMERYQLLGVQALTDIIDRILGDAIGIEQIIPLQINIAIVFFPRVIKLDIPKMSWMLTGIPKFVIFH